MIDPDERATAVVPKWRHKPPRSIGPGLPGVPDMLMRERGTLELIPLVWVEVAEPDDNGLLPFDPAPPPRTRLAGV